MLELPKNTLFGKRIPKQKFYENITITTQIKRAFIEQIKLITWNNKIAPSTMNIAVGETVSEIEVITIKLNQPTLDKRVLAIIDKEIPYHILFFLEYEDKLQAWIGYKEQAKNHAFKTGMYYNTNWLTPTELNLKIDGLNLDVVYENLLRQIAGNRLDSYEDDIKTAINNEERRNKLEKEIAALEKKIQREMQFNRQVEMNAELKSLLKKLEDISNA